MYRSNFSVRTAEAYIHIKHILIVFYGNVKILLRDNFKVMLARIFVTSVIVGCSPVTNSNAVPA